MNTIAEEVIHSFEEKHNYIEFSKKYPNIDKDFREFTIVFLAWELRDSSENKIMGIMSYLQIVFIYAYKLGKEHQDIESLENLVNKDDS